MSINDSRKDSDVKDNGKRKSFNDSRNFCRSLSMSITYMFADNKLLKNRLPLDKIIPL